MFLELPLEIQCEIISLLDVLDIPCLLTATNGQLDDLFLLVTDNKDTPTVVFECNVRKVGIEEYKDISLNHRITLIELHEFNKLDIGQFQAVFSDRLCFVALVNVMKANDSEEELDYNDILTEFLAVVSSKANILLTSGPNLEFSMENVAFPANITVKDYDNFTLNSLDGSQSPLRLDEVRDLMVTGAIERDPLARIDLSEFPTRNLFMSGDGVPHDGFKVVNKRINAESVQLYNVYELQNVKFIGSGAIVVYSMYTPYGDPGIIKNIDAPNLTELSVRMNEGEPLISDLNCPKLSTFEYICNGGNEDIDMNFLSQLPPSIEKIEFLSFNSAKLFKSTSNLKNLRSLSFSLNQSHNTLSPSEYGSFPELTKLEIRGDNRYESNVSVPLINAPKLQELKLLSYRIVSDDNLLSVLHLYPCLMDLQLNLPKHMPSSVDQSLRHASSYLTELCVYVDSLENLFTEPVKFDALRTLDLDMAFGDKTEDIEVELKFIAPVLESFNILSKGVRGVVFDAYPNLQFSMLRGSSLAVVKAHEGLSCLKDLQLYGPIENVDIGDCDELQYFGITLAQGLEFSDVVQSKLGLGCAFDITYYDGAEEEEYD